MAGFCEAPGCAAATERTPRSIIADILGGSMYGFGPSVHAGTRIKIADVIIAELEASGFVVAKLVHTTRKPFVIEDD